MRKKMGKKSRKKEENKNIVKSYILFLVAILN